MTEICVDIDTTSWAIEQKYSIGALAYSLLYAAGDDIIPSVIGTEGGHRICVTNPTCDVSTVLTVETMQALYDEWFAYWEAERIRREAEIAEAEAELAENEIKAASLSNIDAKIDAVSNLAESKVFLKKLTRYIIASKVLNGTLG